MNRLKAVSMIFCSALMSWAFVVGAKAGEWDKSTKVTFNAPVEIPGIGAQVLPAGTYVFRLLDSQADRNMVQILNERQDHVYSTILAIPNSRLQATDKTVITFRERASGQPEAIRAWFFPGDRLGQEFVYPKARAIELAKQTNQPVLTMPTEMAPYLAEPVKSTDEPAAVALIHAPIQAVVPTGEVVPMTVVVAPPLVQTASVRTTETYRSLPRTAGSLPLFGLIGLMAIVGGFGLFFLSKRRV
jgi:hypothetical protein